MSLIAVFIPLLFMTGLVGRMFREFALTLSIAVVVSAAVSLTLTPMMCGRDAARREGRAGAKRSRSLGGCSIFTDRTPARWAVDAAPRCCWLTVATLVLTLWIYRHPEGLPAAAGHGL